jgi:hypothetical protein
MQGWRMETNEVHGHQQHRLVFIGPVTQNDVMASSLCSPYRIEILRAIMVLHGVPCLSG